jgi:sulfur carrier protein ThiS
MRIRLKLMGVLKSRTPEGGALEVADGATIEDALHALGLAPQAAHAVTVNGQVERDRRRALAPDDELTIIPPVGGG